jgi:hypothetical protein
MLASMRDENNYMHFLQSRSTPFVDELTLCSKYNIHTLVDIVIADPTRADLLPQFSQLKDLLPSMQFKVKKRAIVINTQLINYSLWKLR